MNDELDTQGLNADERQAMQAAFLHKEVDAVRTVMQSAGGRYFVFQLLSRAGIFRSCFNADVAVMSWLEGKRELGLVVLDQVMRHCPDLYSLMTEENKNG